MNRAWEKCGYLECGTPDGALSTGVIHYTDLERPFTAQPFYLDVEPGMLEMEIRANRGTPNEGGGKGRRLQMEYGLVKSRHLA